MTCYYSVSTLPICCFASLNTDSTLHPKRALVGYWFASEALPYCSSQIGHFASHIPYSNIYKIKEFAQKISNFHYSLFYLILSTVLCIEHFKGLDVKVGSLMQWMSGIHVGSRKELIMYAHIQ